MKILLDYISAVTGFLAVLFTGLAFWNTRRELKHAIDAHHGQLRQAEEANHAELRAYCVVQYAVVPTPAGVNGVWLEITNFGRTPAFGIILSFDSDEWHEIRPVNFAFMPERGGLTVLAPNQSVRYFVGRLTPTGKLQRLRAGDVTGTMTYKTLGSHGKEVTESFQISLRDFFGAKAIVNKTATKKPAKKPTAKVKTP